MKKTSIFIVVLFLSILCVNFTHTLRAAGDASTAFEYATLRWDGRDNTHVIYANGNVEFLGSKFKDVKKPDRTDERSFFMNLAMNALAREGYELVAMTPDDYVFRRAANH